MQVLPKGTHYIPGYLSRNDQELITNAVRAVVSEAPLFIPKMPRTGKPMSVRISANDWVGEAGVTPAEAVLIAQAFHAAGADLIDVSAGQTTPDAQPVYGRMFQTPFSDRIRNEAGISTMAVGNIYEADHANSILMAGRADLVAVGRPHLADPYWTLREATKIGDRAATDWPLPYLAGRDQTWRLADREAEVIRA